MSLVFVFGYCSFNQSMKALGEANVRRYQHAVVVVKINQFDYLPNLKYVGPSASEQRG